MNAQTKDLILNLIIERSSDCSVAFDIHELSQEINIGVNTIQNIFEYFSIKGLITYKIYMGGAIDINVLIPAFDLKNKGGFLGLEILEQANIELLFKQLQEIKTSDNTTKVELIITTLQTIFAGISAFK